MPVLLFHNYKCGQKIFMGKKEKKNPKPKKQINIQEKDSTNQTRIPWQNEHCQTYIILYPVMMRQNTHLI